MSPFAASELSLPAYEALLQKIKTADCECGVPSVEDVVQISHQGECRDMGNGNFILMAADAKIQPLSVAFKGSGNTLIVGAGALLDKCTITIDGSRTITTIGAKATLRSVRIGTRDDNVQIAIGSKAAWRGGSLSHSGFDNHVIIGDDCMFAAGLIMRSTDGHGIFDRSTGKRLNESRAIIVHDHVWLGSGVRVSKGAVVGSGTVVGQLSLVTGRLDANCIYAGAPARKMRENIAWSRGQAWESVPQKFRHSGTGSPLLTGAAELDQGAFPVEQE